MEWVLTSERLDLKKITKEDFEQLCAILQDAEIMYAWEHTFDYDEVWEWIEKNLIRYANEGFSYFAAIEKNTHEFIGVIGPLIEEIHGVKYIGIGYILNKRYWGKGYASEGAKACMDYAFDCLNADKVIAQIRPNNLSSRKVAENVGMKIESEYIKRYRNADMPHLIYSRAK